MCALMLVTVLLFIPVLRFGFVYDDAKQVLGNPALRSWQGISSAFQRQVWSFDPTKQVGTYYRPLFIAALTVLFQLCGENPSGYHAAALLLHLVAGIFVFRLGVGLGLSRFARIFATGVFWLHPLQIQAVAWVSAITDPLYALCLLAALCAWIDFLRNARLASALLALAGYGAALLLLERAYLGLAAFVALSFAREPLGLCADAEPVRSTRTRALRALQHGAWFGGVLGCVLVLRWRVLPPKPGAIVEPMLDSVRHAPSALLRYLRNGVWPEQLSLAYPEHFSPAPGLLAWTLRAGACLIALFAAWLLSRQRPIRCWLGGTALLLMAASLCVGVLPGYALVQDRYAYVPMAFVALWIGDVLSPVMADARWQVRAPIVAGMGLACALWLSLHGSNLAYFRDNLALYERAIATDPDNAQFLINLSNERARHGDDDPSCALLRHADAVLKADARAADAILLHFNLGNCLRVHGEARAALAEYAQARVLSHAGLSAAFVNAVIASWDLGDAAGAERLARELVAAQPRAAKAWQILGATLGRAGRHAEARDALQRAVALDPGDPATRRMLAASAAVAPAPPR